MSIRVMNWAWSQRTGGTTPKLILLKLADNTNDHGFCFPSISLIAELCEIDERTVQRNIRLLEQLALLTVKPRYASRGRQTSNVYQLACPPPGVATVSQNRGGKLPPSTGNENTPPPAGEASTGDTVDARTTNEPSLNCQQQPNTGGGHLTQLVFPPCFNDQTKAAAVTRLARLEFDAAQLVLDELAGRMKITTVHNPLRYLAILADRAASGQFTPDLATQLQAGRQARTRNEALAATRACKTPSEVVPVRIEDAPRYMREFLKRHAVASKKNGSE